MTFKEIKDLLQHVSESELSEVRIKNGDFELTVRNANYAKTRVAQQTMMAAPAMQVAAPAPIAQPAVGNGSGNIDSTAANNQEAESTLLEVKSPIVGTFYRSASPDKPSFVSIGDTISEGSVVCIVEAMKLFNEIESEVAGKVVKVLVDDATPVEYDQVLFLVDPNG